MEIWKEIEGYQGLYKISNFGDVMSLKSGKILKQSKSKDGYMRVGLSKDGKERKMYVHRLVALAFIPNPENKPQVNHKDVDKTNNCVDNLEWSTQSENQIHAFKNNLYNDRSGENNNNHKLSDADVEYIRNNYKPRHKKFGAKPLAERFGVNRRHIGLIVNGKSRV